MRADRHRRLAVWVALILGGVESVSLLLKAGQRNPSALVAVLFSGWVLAPFAALAWANIASRRWSSDMESLVHGVTVLVSAVSLALYARWIPMPAGSPNAFVFVATPPAMVMILAFGFATVRALRGLR